MSPFINVWQTLIYGVFKRTPNIDFSEIPAELTFNSGYDKEHDVHFVVSPELPEFIATGKTSEELAKNVGDTILVYFDVPHYFARNFKDGIFNFTNQKTGKHETLRVDKKELDRVLA